MAGMACLVPRNTPLTFTPIIWSHCSSVASSMARVPRVMPALFTSTSSLAVLALGQTHGPPPVFLHRDVQVDVGSLSAQLSYLGLHLLPLLVQDVSEHHPGTLLGKEPGLLLALAPGTAAYDRHLTVQPTHSYTLFLRLKTPVKGLREAAAH